MCQQPAIEPQSIGFKNGQSLIRSERENRACRVAANARQGQHLVVIGGKPPFVPRYDHSRRPVQLPGTPIVAQSLPVAQNFRFLGLGQRTGVGKSPQEPLVVAQHRDDLRLLEHDLADPNGIGIAGIAPRQIAPMAAIPGEQSPAK